MIPAVDLASKEVLSAEETLKITEEHHRRVQSIPKGKAGGGKRRLLLLELGWLISCFLGVKADASKEYRQAKDGLRIKNAALQMAEKSLEEALKAVPSGNAMVCC